MQPKIRILSFHHIPNNGAFLFAHSLMTLLKYEFPDVDVKILDYRSKRLTIYEYLKRFNFFQEIPLFYMKRGHLWGEQINMHLDLDKDFPRFSETRALQNYFSKYYDALVIGMDVWCIINDIERPKFPNIYWLPEKTALPKLAYGVSAYNSELSLIQKSTSKISEYLNGFDVIGARDRFTYRLIQEHRTRDDGIVDIVPDPTFAHEIQETGVQIKLQKLGIDLDRPVLGLLLFGDDFISNEIRSHYKAKGYQILAMGMYNAFADINLGHLLTPFEWAETFQYLSFCITDRFHGAIFCLKSNTPFVSLEKERDLSQDQSKIYDLLAEFDLEACYQNPADETFEITSFLALTSELEAAWEQAYTLDILAKINGIKEKHTQFIHKMKLEFRGRI